MIFAVFLSFLSFFLFAIYPSLYQFYKRLRKEIMNTCLSCSFLSVSCRLDSRDYVVVVTLCRFYVLIISSLVVAASFYLPEIIG